MMMLMMIIRSAGDGSSAAAGYCWVWRAPEEIWYGVCIPRFWMN